jgi:hypothetical protein
MTIATRKRMTRLEYLTYDDGTEVLVWTIQNDQYVGRLMLLFIQQSMPTN